MRVPYVSDELVFEPIAEELWGTDDSLLLRFCGSCRDALVKMHRRGMKAMWNRLPEVFNVDIDKDVWRSGLEAGANRKQ